MDSRATETRERVKIIPRSTIPEEKWGLLVV